MEINFAETKAIVDTLPIGLYAKRRVPVSMSNDAETSYYNPISDEIVISYPIIARGLKKAIGDDDYKETAVRSMQYHEVSHAILTPDRLTMTDWMNIFEDERIETILGDYYYNTDFKKQVLSINGFSSATEISKPKNGMEYFYQIVRFGLGEKKYLDKVNELIKRYAKLSKQNDRDSYNYYYDVKALYEEIVDDFTENNGGDGESGEGEGGGSGGASLDKVDNSDKDGKKSSSSTSKASASSSSAEDGEKAKNGTKTEGEPLAKRESPLSHEEINKIFENFFSSNPYHDTNLTQKMEMIINSFSKKNNSGGAMNAYSGTFNPRYVGQREDYKFWEKPATINGANKFGSLHLNLFIDKSGSFYWSTEPMNKLLNALTEIESKNKNFTLDVVFCGMGEEIVKDKRGRLFEASGGNYLDAEIYDIYRKLQKPNTFNYNIACFDGDACSDGGRNDHGFGAFDHNNCTIISDDDNKRYIDKDVHSAKVIYTRNYADELIDNVVAILAKAFR